MVFKKNNIEVFPVIVRASNKLKSYNFFLVKGEHSLLLIDTGLNNEDCWNSLQRTLINNGFTIADITGVLLTHHHTDHIGLVNRIGSTRPIPVYAHPYAKILLNRDIEYVKMRVEFFRKLYQEMGCGEIGEQQVSNLKNPIILGEKNMIRSEIIEFTNNQLYDFNIFEIPGHAPDQAAFYHKKSKWLFAGDLLIENLTSNAYIEPNYDGSRTNSVLQQKKSLENCLSLDPELVFSGHGRIINNPNDLIKRRIKEIDEKAGQYINIIKSGIRTASELAKILYNERYEKQFFSIMSQVIGYLDYLELQGKIKKEMEKGICHYYI
jgi:glyoxylase-like metal-dependent hydrolase (beta-lactamase superfamily II)